MRVNSLWQYKHLYSLISRALCAVKNLLHFSIINKYSVIQHCVLDGKILQIYFTVLQKKMTTMIDLHCSPPLLHCSRQPNRKHRRYPHCLLCFPSIPRIRERSKRRFAHGLICQAGKYHCPYQY